MADPVLNPAEWGILVKHDDGSVILESIKDDSTLLEWDRVLSDEEIDTVLEWIRSTYGWGK